MKEIFSTNTKDRTKAIEYLYFIAASLKVILVLIMDEIGH